MRKTARNAAIIADSLTGRRHDEIAVDHGISRVRVSKIIIAAGAGKGRTGRPPLPIEPADRSYYAKLRDCVGVHEARRAMGIMV